MSPPDQPLPPGYPGKPANDDAGEVVRLITLAVNLIAKQNAQIEQLLTLNYAALAVVFAAIVVSAFALFWAHL
jgi:hypothetical protein